MKRGWTWAAVALLVAAVVIALQVRQEQDTRSENGAQTERQDRHPAGEPAPHPKGSEPIIARGADSSPTVHDPEFQKWLSQEARSLDHAQVDGELKEREIQSVVAKLTSNQARQLLQTARNPVAPSREKILATYLLTQGGLNSRAELRALATTPIDSSGTPTPHTMDEVNGIRDKSLRIMAIDGLASQAVADKAARESLAKAIPDIDDPYIKAYAQKKWDELSRR